MAPRRIAAGVTAALACERGGVSVLVGLTVPALLIVAGLAADFTRAAALRERMQTAADGAVREVVRGADAAQITAYVQAVLAPALARTGGGAADSPTILVTGTGTAAASVQISATYQTPFGVFRAAAGQPPTMTVSATQRAFCTASGTRWVPVSQACPAGQSGMVTFDREERLTCPSPTSEPDWAETGTVQNYASSCADG
ncbi:TadE/TadG family type IV pilus assembly protein [Aquabacter spiritensis]|uniref:Putative Flp pilus-assembly TadE/G-like protein n=1 Tax=Aquabacter spiritensis TaxID=933073 RepID=A0A4R3M847_9HYPH|nr:pilus assembly protein TadG-related protein [Aquabacter spiritensis]TCT07515.1 putative Flp pilus-assembly TadE/G-like protein [Aquabacter spiritensis]